jgi:type VI secretion system protein ImpC
LSRTGMYQQFVQRTVGPPGGQPWAAIVGQYMLGPTQEDIETLANVAQLAGLADAPFLTGAHSAIVGCASLAETQNPNAWQLDPTLADLWQQLRQLPHARFLGLALPRFLLRLPFDKDTSGFDAFAFDEMPAGSSHESYLWGNPALPVTLLLGQAFTQEGWSLRTGIDEEIDGLPLHIYHDGEEALAKPCGEVILRAAALERLLDHGLMPLICLPAKDTIRVARFQSAAAPLVSLAGRWS